MSKEYLRSQAEKLVDLYAIRRPPVEYTPQELRYAELAERVKKMRAAETMARRRPTAASRAVAEAAAKEAVEPAEWEALAEDVMAAGRLDGNNQHLQILYLIAGQPGIGAELLDKLASLDDFFGQSSLDTAVATAENTTSETLAKIVERGGRYLYWGTAEAVCANENVTEETLFAILDNAEDGPRIGRVAEVRKIWEAVAESPRATAAVLAKVVDAAPWLGWRRALEFEETTPATIEKILAYLRKRWENATGWSPGLPLVELAAYPGATEEMVIVALTMGDDETQRWVADKVEEWAGEGRQMSPGLALAARMVREGGYRWRGEEAFYQTVGDLSQAPTTVPA